MPVVCNVSLQAITNVLIEKVFYILGEVNQKTEWHRICVFKPYLRDSTFKYTMKGQRVLVQGRIIYGEVKESDGQLRHTCSIVADDVIFFKNG